MLVRWALQKGVAVIPKASSQAHLLENKDVFSFRLTDEEVHIQDHRILKDAHIML